MPTTVDDPRNFAYRALLIAVLARLGGLELLAPVLAAAQLTIVQPDALIGDPVAAARARAELDAVSDSAREALALLCG